MAPTAAGVALALSALVLAPAWGRAQTRAGGVQCPRVRVSCPDALNVSGPITFTAEVTGGVPVRGATFRWDVSAGELTTGQGELSIVVDAAGADRVEATVEVGGLPPSCPNSAICRTIIVRCGLSKLDAYGDIAEEDEQARLDNFAIELQNDPTSRGYVIAYGGRRGRAGEARRRADRAKDYLVNTRGISADRIVTVDGGFREDLTVELFIIPAGANAPAAAPTVEPDEVEIIP